MFKYTISLCAEDQTMFLRHAQVWWCAAEKLRNIVWNLFSHSFPPFVAVSPEVIEVTYKGSSADVDASEVVRSPNFSPYFQEYYQNGTVYVYRIVNTDPIQGYVQIIFTDLNLDTGSSLKVSGV